MIRNCRAVRVESIRDDRDPPLVPNCATLDNAGPVNPLTVDKPLVWVTCGGTGKYFKLDCVTPLFGRLGAASQKLVVSLYRAILERFFVMDSAGSCCARPDFGCVLGLDFMTEINHVFCADEAVLNMRRAFGGDYFRQLVAGVLDRLESATVPNCGVPIVTPFAGGTLFEQPCGGDTWCAMLGNWLHDLSMRKDSKIAYNCYNYWGGGKLLMRSVVCAYRQAQCNGFVDDADEFVCWFNNQHCVLTPENEPMGNFAEWCNCWTNSMFRRECNRLAFGDKFFLPALALALRILSVWNVRTVRRSFDTTLTAIKHVRIRASKYRCFVWDECYPEEFSFEKCIVCLPEVTFDVHGTRSNQSLYLPAGSLYTTIDLCDSTNPNHIITPTAGCRIRYYQDEGSGSSALCGWAFAGLCAIWPCFNLECTPHLIGAHNSAYPAKWAWKEGDICEAFATGFVGMTGLPSGFGGGFGRIFRHKIPGFGGWQGSVDESITCLAASLGDVILRCSGHQLSGFPISSSDAKSYLGDSCGGCFTCYCWSFVGKKYFLTPGGDGLSVCYCGILEPIHYCAPFGGWMVGRVGGANKSAFYPNRPFGQGPITVRFGGTFFETYRFNNRAAKQVRQS